MNHRDGQVIACVLGIDSQTCTDLSQWKSPIALQYCVAEVPIPKQFERTDEMTQLEAAGFVPLALVVTDADGHAGLGLMVRDDLPATLREYLAREAQKIFEQAGKEHLVAKDDHRGDRIRP